MEYELEIRYRGKSLSSTELDNALMGEPVKVILRTTVYSVEKRLKENLDKFYCPHHGAPKRFKIVVSTSTIDEFLNPSVDIEGCCTDFQTAARAILMADG